MVKIIETVAQNGVIRLPIDVPASARCVVTILDDNLEGLRKEAHYTIPEEKQRRMSELLMRNREGELTPGESQELDVLAEEFETATLSKGRALAALANLNGDSQQD